MRRCVSEAQLVEQALVERIGHREHQDVPRAAAAATLPRARRRRADQHQRPPGRTGRRTDRASGCQPAGDHIMQLRLGRRPLDELLPELAVDAELALLDLGLGASCSCSALGTAAHQRVAEVACAMRLLTAGSATAATVHRASSAADRPRRWEPAQHWRWRMLGILKPDPMETTGRAPARNRAHCAVFPVRFQQVADPSLAPTRPQHAATIRG